MSPGRVRFGPEIFRFQRRGGVSRYIGELHRGLIQRGVDSGIVAGLHISSMLEHIPSVEGRSVAWLPQVRARQALTLSVDRRVARRAAGRLGPGDIWHPSYFDVAPPTRAALAVTVYDMVHELFPSGVGSRDRTPRYKEQLCRAADVVFCISRTTADDVQEMYGIDDDRIVVTHLGAERRVPVVHPRPFGERPFVLYVGARGPSYKNWRLLIEALRLANADLRLLCIGEAASRAELQLVSDSDLTDRVAFEAATDEEMAGRFTQAEALIYPSRYEGFGLPPVEALLHGCPVLASNATAIREVVGEVAHLVPPELEALVAGLELIGEGSPVIARQRTEGPAFAERYTWSATTAATLVGYERAVG